MAKQLVWIGSSRRDLKRFPQTVRRQFGQALFAAQLGGLDPAAKPLKGFPGATVMEIVERYDTDAYRAIYTTRLGDIVFVLHAFQKKSKSGIKTPKAEIERIQSRLVLAREIFQELKT